MPQLFSVQAPDAVPRVHSLVLTDPVVEMLAAVVGAVLLVPSGLPDFVVMTFLVDGYVVLHRLPSLSFQFLGSCSCLPQSKFLWSRRTAVFDPMPCSRLLMILCLLRSLLEQYGTDFGVPVMSAARSVLVAYRECCRPIAVQMMHGLVLEPSVLLL